MSTNDPMTQERLDAIQGRAESVAPLQHLSPGYWQRLALHLSEDVDALLAEVARLRALTTVDRDMLARAQREYEWSGNIRYVLEAALTPGWGA